MDAREPFDRRLRRVRRDRAAAGFDEHGFVQRHIAAELLARLDSVTRDFRRALVLGYAGEELVAGLTAKGIGSVTADPGWRFAKVSGGVQCDEDRLPFADKSFDLVLSAGMLDSINDLPGALLLTNRVLRPDGLFLAGFAGAGSLATLRGAAMAAEIDADRIAPRIHPQIDVRAAGDLLGRAGFVLAVADGDTLTACYRAPGRLIADLRGAGLSSLLGGPSFDRERTAALLRALENSRDGEGKIVERFALVYLTGWTPGPDPPTPARRGSGKTSLADVLKSRT